MGRKKNRKNEKEEEIVINEPIPDKEEVEEVEETEEAGIPCICIIDRGRWFCMKEVDGALIQCDGPFATKAECEEHMCI